MLVACGPGAADPGEGSGSGSGTSGGPEDDTGSGESSMPMTTAPTTTGSHDTDYPVDPGCDESDEGYGEYDESSGGGGSSGTSGVEDTGIGMTGNFPLAATVYEIKSGGIPGGELVELTSVVVTAPPVLAADGERTLVFVQEQDGGPNSGINLQIEFTTPEVDALLPGDRITVRGDFIERYVFAIIDIYDAEGAIDIIGSGPVPEPILVDPAMVSAGGELAASLESVLVEVEQAEVIDPAACPGEVLVQASLKVDDRFLAADGIALPAPPSGIYSRVAGPLIYTYTGFEIAPRSLDDLGL